MSRRTDEPMGEVVAPLYAPLKRGADAVASACLLVVLSPLLAVIALLVRSRLGPPVVFRQARPGLNGRSFVILKFRTMRQSHDPAGAVLPDAERLTGLGCVLRRWSLDELPELWNVLRGEMSLVGPRPLLMEYLPLYTASQARRHAVRPGLSGLAQVKGRNALSWEEKFELDIWYVDHLSPVLDLNILFRTIGQVLGGRTVNHAGHATMPLFRGSTARPGEGENG